MLSLRKVVVAMWALLLVYIVFWGQREPSPRNRHGSLTGKVELTVRMGLNQKDIHHFFCSLLRSMVLFWNPAYGDVVIILDKEDAGKGFETRLNSLRLPYRFRFAYEALPAARLHHLVSGRYRRLGYLRQIYSTFLLDMYNSAPIIGLTDTDAVFTMPVLEESITKDKKLIAKGLHSFSLGWVQKWDRATANALGLPLVSDFMTNFPAYVYASTIKNCRLHIMKTLGVKEWDDAFLKMHIGNVWLSPVSMILTYAYYFERDLYDWHIATGPVNLQQYNKDRLPNHPLLEKDITPEPLVTAHIRHYHSPVHPLQQAICYAQIYLGAAKAKMLHCKQFYGKPNVQLYVFQNDFGNPSFLEQWCQGASFHACAESIRKRYEMFVKLYGEGRIALNVNLVSKVEQLADEEYKQKCPSITYMPFPEPNWT